MNVQMESHMAELIGGPMDGHREVVLARVGGLAETTFIYKQRCGDVVQVAAYAWDGTHTAKGLVRLRFLMIVGEKKKF